MIDLTQATYHVEQFANRIRSGQRPTIGQGIKDMVMTCWRATERREDVEAIMRAYPAEFPMTRKMGAD